MKRTPQALLIGGLAAAVAVAAFVAFRGTSSTTVDPSGIGSDVGRTIPAKGAKLAAEVVIPTRARNAPLIVMPGGWGQPSTEYRAVARDLASRGYVVVGYAQRGFSTSTGEVDFAGADSQRDASTVITWALAHTPSDPKRIGMLGASYGAGIALLAAAHDRRIRAVTALSTWADVGATFDQSNTPSTAALTSLIGAARPPGRFGSVIKRLRNTLASQPRQVGIAVRAISKNRSPQTYVAQLNKNGPAIMLANAFADSIFPPGQLIPFFTALTTPKRLELAAGDHGGPELGGLLGQPNKTIDDATAWFDHFLDNKRNGIQSEGPIILRDARTNGFHEYKTWPRAASRDRVHLGAPNSAAETGDGIATNWRTAITSGTDSGASSGRAQLVPSASYAPPQVLTKNLSRKTAFVWSGPAVLNPLVLNGTPSMDVAVGSSAGTATVYLYLYDVTAQGVGTLIDMQPYTALGLSAGSYRPVTITMQPISWTVPRNDHLTVVIDTVDARYTSRTPSGATVGVASSSKHPAYFAIPVQRT